MSGEDSGRDTPHVKGWVVLRSEEGTFYFNSRTKTFFAYVTDETLCGPWHGNYVSAKDYASLVKPRDLEKAIEQQPYDQQGGRMVGGRGMTSGELKTMRSGVINERYPDFLEPMASALGDDEPERLEDLAEGPAGDLASVIGDLEDLKINED